MADDANDDMDTKPKRAQEEPIPPADPNYPEYTLKFARGANVGRISGIFGREIPGSHTLVISAGSRRVQISYTHHDPDDPKPILNVLIEEEPRGRRAEPGSAEAQEPCEEGGEEGGEEDHEESREEDRQEDGEGAGPEGGQEGCEESRHKRRR